MNEELHYLYSSPSIIRIIKSRRMRCAWHVLRMGEKLNAYRILVGRPEGKRPLRRHRRKWEADIKMDLGEMGKRSYGLNSSDSEQRRVAGSCEHGNELSGPIKFGKFLST
jgi:hypothetical protein